ncbi:MAG: adenosine kinase [Proteobacteria bacterium]|nr:adenosine kinase [Pseudomonadota bacterium]
MNVDVFGLGNALVDALVVLDERPLLNKHQLKRGTMHLVSDERWRGVYEEVPHDGVVLHPGGSCANAVSTVALLGGTATFCGLVGTDELADRYTAGLQEVLGGHLMVQRPGIHTGKCLSLVSNIDAERTMLTDLGAAMELTPAEVPTEAVERSSWLHITGYLFTGGEMAAAAEKALDRALHAGTKVSFDLGDAFVIDHFRESVDRVIEKYADVVFMNEDEARKLGGGDAMQCFHDLAERVDTVVLKLGKRGSIIKRGTDVVPIEAILVDAIDTTGAGDSYAGGFLYGLSQAWPIEACGHLASAVAALTVSQLGGVIRDAEALATVRGRVVPS